MSVRAQRGLQHDPQYGQVVLGDGLSGRGPQRVVLDLVQAEAHGGDCRSGGAQRRRPAVVLPATIAPASMGR
ncbi:hypothetical protein GCM10010170_026170 [Dactylosporangium salmoneum]|uniref:Uncharacterized protein n=1 Tax=Dactylosporangium salmoneum TaxID=53361 RepID=A0ABP5SZB5_9ACTN